MRECEITALDEKGEKILQEANTKDDYGKVTVINTHPYTVRLRFNRLFSPYVKLENIEIFFQKLGAEGHIRIKELR